METSAAVRSGLVDNMLIRTSASSAWNLQWTVDAAIISEPSGPGTPGMNGATCQRGGKYRSSRRNTHPVIPAVISAASCPGTVGDSPAPLGQMLPGLPSCSAESVIGDGQRSWRTASGGNRLSSALADQRYALVQYDQLRSAVPICEALRSRPRPS